MRKGKTKKDKQTDIHIKYDIDDQRQAGPALLKLNHSALGYLGYAHFPTLQSHPSGLPGVYTVFGMV